MCTVAIAHSRVWCIWLERGCVFETPVHIPRGATFVRRGIVVGWGAVQGATCVPQGD